MEYDRQRKKIAVMFFSAVFDGVYTSIKMPVIPYYGRTLKPFL